MHSSGRFTKLKVVAVDSYGAYLDWGQPAPLYLPKGEQLDRVSVGQEVVVFIVHEPPMASMRLDDYVDPDTTGLRVGQKVSLLVARQTHLGFLAIVEGRHFGMLYASEVFQPLAYGSQMTGFVKKIREDGKIDLILQQVGRKGTGDLGLQILERLRDSGGFLPLTDHSTPETIYSVFGVSKKKYKMALGGIYKKKLVSIDADGIRLAVQD